MSETYLDGIIDLSMFVLKAARTDRKGLAEITKDLDGILQEVLLERAQNITGRFW